jgi:dihydrofolate reductase
MAYRDDMMGQVMGETFAKRTELLLGRKTYEIFAAYWPHAKDDPGTDNLNNAKKYVVSRTLDKVDWNNSTLIKGDVVKEITRLKGLD